MENDDLLPEERKAFDSLPRQAMPPQNLEKEIIKELKSKNIIQQKERKKLSWIAYPVAASLIFSLGFISANYMNSSLNEDSTYMMILFEDENFYVGNSAEAAKEYGQWSQLVKQSGIKLHGQELRNIGHEISNGEVTLLEADHANRITGYFVLEAKSDDEALAIARENPHLKYGGKIQLKRFRKR
ncbi:hypothetical protein [Ekhidna sp.]|uniref:YciI family protein n=1 Tax=Ekhidna sp. TaxID=2608089 RepID=UPI003296C8BC